MAITETPPTDVDPAPGDNPFGDPPSPENRPGTVGSGDSDRPGRPRLRDRLRRTPREPKAEKPPKTDESRPKRSTRRRSDASDDITDALVGMGGLVINHTRFPATGNALTINAGVGGIALDDAIKGTFIDRRAVQPAIRARARLEGVAAIFEIPTITFMIEMNPTQDNLDRWVPWLESAVKRSIPLLVPLHRRLEAKEKAFAEAAAELYPELGPGADPVRAMVEKILAPILATAAETQQQQPSEGALPDG